MISGSHLAAAIQRIIDCVQSDAGPNGGLLSFDTIRACDEARLILGKHKKQSKETKP